MRHILFVLSAGLAMPFAAQASISISPGFIQFYANSGGPTQYRTARVTNFGPSDTGNITVQNSCFSQVYVSSDCYFSLHPNQSCELDVQFTPNQSGHVSCSVDVSTANGGYDHLSIMGDVR